MPKYDLIYKIKIGKQ